MKEAFDTLEALRVKLNEIEDGLAELGRDNWNQAKEVEASLGALRAFRDSLYVVDSAFEKARK